jgi:hypothetical protein
MFGLFSPSLLEVYPAPKTSLWITKLSFVDSCQDGVMKITCPVCESCEIDISAMSGVISGFCQTCELQGTQMLASMIPSIWISFLESPRASSE